LKNLYENTENKDIDTGQQKIETQFQRYIQTLREELQLELPGEQAQLKMAPPHRPAKGFDAESRNAGVLILLYPENSGIYTVLIKRPVYKGVHSGQISLPGGKYEYDKDQNIIDTAFRETHEEVGIHQNAIHFLGQLTPLFIPVSNIHVQPVIGYLTKKPSFIPDSREVDKIYKININDLLAPECITEDEIILENQQKIIAPFYKLDHIKVWGATAMILSEFFEIHQKTFLNPLR